MTWLSLDVSSPLGLRRRNRNGRACPGMRILIADGGRTRELKVLRDLVCLRPLKRLSPVQLHLIVTPAPYHTGS